MRGARATVALAVLGLAGCMVGPDYRRPEVATPAAFGELGQRPDPSQAMPEPVAAIWWTSFDDQMLTSLIERAVGGNLDVRQAEARVREARASRRLAASELWPQAGSAASYAHQRTSKNGIGVAPGHSFDLYQVGFDAAWELDVFGGIRRGVEAAEAGIAAAEADRDAVLVSLMAEVGLEYVTYRSLQQRILLANENLKVQQATRDLTHRLLSSGLAPELDVTRAEAQVATTASTIPILEQQAAQAMHRLGVLLGQPPMTLAEELAPVGPIPAAPATVSVGLPSELLLRRPDVARSEREVAAATAQIGVARRDLFPRFFITGVAGLQSLHASDLFDWESRLASIGPSITWPVFQGGAIRANIDLKTATREEFLAAYEGVVLQAFQDVEDALVAFSRQQTTRARLEDAVRADRRSAELARTLYAQGLTDFLTVLDAQRSLFLSQDTLAQSQRDVALDLVALYKAVGGGWQAAPAVP